MCPKAVLNNVKALALGDYGFVRVSFQRLPLLYLVNLVSGYSASFASLVQGLCEVFHG